MKEVVYPTVYFTRNTIPAKFMDQMYVADFVKSLSKVQYADISLKTACYLQCHLPNQLVVFRKKDEHEPGKDVMHIGVVHNASTDYMFHQFVNNACQTNRSVIGALMFLPFLENWCNVGFTPIPRNNTIMQ